MVLSKRYVWFSMKLLRFIDFLAMMDYIKRYWRWLTQNQEDRVTHLYNPFKSSKLAALISYNHYLHQMYPDTMWFKIITIKVNSHAHFYLSYSRLNRNKLKKMVRRSRRKDIMVVIWKVVRKKVILCVNHLHRSSLLCSRISSIRWKVTTSQKLIELRIFLVIKTEFLLNYFWPKVN